MGDIEWSIKQRYQHLEEGTPIVSEMLEVLTSQDRTEKVRLEDRGTYVYRIG